MEGHSMWILATAFSPSTLPLPPARPHPLNTLGVARSFILLARSVRMITSIAAEERAGQNACSVYDRSRVQDGVGPIDPRDSSLFRANDRLPKSWPELQIRLTQLARESLRRQAWPTSEFVREHQAGLQSFRSMRRIDARRKNASALRLRFSQSLASLRQRLSQAMVRSTTQRRGSTTNPLA